MGILANENAISSGGYQISNSLRFQRASSQYLSRTPASAGNRKTYTYSVWFKRGQLGVNNAIFSCNNGLSDALLNTYYFNTSDVLVIGGYNTNWRVTSQVFRDPSAWYHLVIAIDTTQATGANRVKLYVNGQQITAFSSSADPTLNFDTAINQAAVHYISTYNGSADFIDGYAAEINFVDGQALTPSSFGTTDAISGQWVAKKYTGTYGTNGFYLPFSNGTSTTTLGADSSGNGNNWTLTNFTRSAGVSDCWMYDVPSGNGSSGTQPNSNYAVLNPLWKGSPETIANGNLNVTSSGTGGSALSTIQMPSGKWYAEATINTGSDATIVGICASTFLPTSALTGSNSVGYYGNNGHKIVNGVDTAYGATYTTGDVIGIALDADAGTVTFYKNNTSQGAITIGLSAPFLFATSDVSSTSNINQSWNFGQRSFAYTPPSGFKALCTANLPASTIVKGNQYMDATTYTSNGGVQTVTNASGFKPDLVWTKPRSNIGDHALNDSVRGTSKILISNLTNAESTNANYLTSFNSNGFSIGTGNWTNGYTMVAWQWQAGQGTTSSNTNGSITSTVSVNATAGFSVVTYTSQTSGTGTIGHGLGVAPAVIINKPRTGTVAWTVYHQSLGNNAYLILNTTAAQVTGATTVWNSTSPTSTVFSQGTAFAGLGTMVAYCFAEIAGFSKFGSYTGNGSADGPFVYTGFRPKFILIKKYAGGTNADWHLHDTARDTYNSSNTILLPDSSGAEAVNAAFAIDVLSNGFKLRTADASTNGPAYNHIFIAFAENPFQNSNAR